MVKILSVLNVCYVSYWGVHEGLTEATVLPHVRILAGKEMVKSVHLITMERSEMDGNPFMLEGVNHHPIISGTSTLNKLKDKNRVEGQLKQLHKEGSIDLIIARTSLAGRLVMDFAKRTEIPLVVESFEPHAEYMVEDGVWKKNGLKYRVARKAEKQQMDMARFIFPVSKAYASVLKSEYPKHIEKVVSMPCCVDMDLFKFSEHDREAVRKKLGFKDSITGIYTGKLGGIYLDDEAIDLISECRDYFGVEKFRMIVLTPQTEYWESKLQEAGFDSDHFFVDTVQLSDVPMYLSSADFAFSLHRPTPSKIAITPIKNAEYLANGLPIVLPRGIGDDSDEVRTNKLGVLLNNELSLGAEDLAELNELIQQTRPNALFTKWVESNRSFDIVRSNYQMVLNSISG